MPVLQIGPEEKWEIELAKVSRAGLVYLASRLITCGIYAEPFDRERTMEIIQEAYRAGRCINRLARIDEYLTDPEGTTRKWARQQKAAKKAARTKKRARKVK